jgi:xanthine dehydrogenase YagS FAD-binding subunit
MYRKVRDRASYAFAVVSVAAVLTVAEEQITDVRLALGGVAHRPWRARIAEDVLRGREPSENNFRTAIDAELTNAVALEGIDGGNGFKIPLVTRTVVSVLRDLAEGAPQ